MSVDVWLFFATKHMYVTLRICVYVLYSKKY